MERRRGKRFTFKPTARSRRDEVIDKMKPISQQKGTVQPRKLMVFADNGRIVLSVASERGTLTVPLSRISAANLSNLLVKQLANIS